MSNQMSSTCCSEVFLDSYESVAFCKKYVSFFYCLRNNNLYCWFHFQSFRMRWVKSGFYAHPAYFLLKLCTLHVTLQSKLFLIFKGVKILPEMW